MATRTRRPPVMQRMVPNQQMLMQQRLMQQRVVSPLMMSRMGLAMDSRIPNMVIPKPQMKVTVDSGASKIVDGGSGKPVVELTEVDNAIIDTGVEPGIEVTTDEVPLVAPSELGPPKEGGGIPWKLVIGAGLLGFAWYKWKK